MCRDLHAPVSAIGCIRERRISQLIAPLSALSGTEMHSLFSSHPCQDHLEEENELQHIQNVLKKENEAKRGAKDGCKQ